MNLSRPSYSQSMVVKKKGRLRIRRKGRQKRSWKAGGKRKEERDFVSSSSSKEEHGALAHNNPLFYEMVVPPLKMTHTVLSSKKIVQYQTLSHLEIKFLIIGIMSRCIMRFEVLFTAQIWHCVEFCKKSDFSGGRSHLFSLQQQQPTSSIAPRIFHPIYHTTKQGASSQELIYEANSNNQDCYCLQQCSSSSTTLLFTSTVTFQSGLSLLRSVGKMVTQSFRDIVLKGLCFYQQSPCYNVNIGFSHTTLQTKITWLEVQRYQLGMFMSKMAAWAEK